MRAALRLLGCLLTLLPAVPCPGALSAPPGTEPVVRIGIGELHERLEIVCRSGIQIRTLDSEGGSVRVPPPTSLVVRPGVSGKPVPAPTPLFRVLFSSSRNEATVRRAAAWTREQMPDVEVVVFHNEERDAWRAYAGNSRSRNGASSLVARLIRHGLDRVWITERTAEEAERRDANGALRVEMKGAGGFVDVQEAGRVVRLEPVGDVEPLHAGGVAYRGVLEVRTGPPGTMRLINEVPMEDYLRGVVPKEMSPGLFPQLEALKAQAVAARTYAYRHLGQFAELGYDLCDSQRCQAYGGIDAEQRLSDRAVRETRGRILTTGEGAIRAYYTASCGGHTENVEEMFPEETGSYLRGVPCPAEAPEGLVLRGRGPVDILQPQDGGPLNYALAWLVVRGLVPGEVLDREYGWAVAGTETGAWAEALASLVRRHGDRPDAGVIATGATLSPGRDEPRLSRAQWLAAAAARLWSAENEEQAGRVVLASGNTLRVRSAGKARELDPSAVDYLFVREQGAQAEGATLERTKPVAALVVRRGDQVRWIEDAAGRARILVAEGDAGQLGARLFPPRGGWNDGKTGPELLARLASRTGITKLSSLAPLRLTPSGRVSEVGVEAGAESLRLWGIRVRWGLGLRENLFDPYGLAGASADGGLAVRGHGWGHGVGLCQTGTGGLARGGADYQQILLHYYPGATLDRAW